MAYSDYQAPGVDVVIERSNVVQQSPSTEFYPVFVGPGMTSRNRNIQKTNIRANTEDFPRVRLGFDLVGEINTDLFEETTFTLGQVVVTRASAPEDDPGVIALEPTTGYEVVEDVNFSTYDTTASVTINILDPNVTANDLIYEINLTASNVDRDFDLLQIGTEDRFFATGSFGPIVLEENDNQFYNGIAIAAEMAFRMEVPRWYYLEVPRDYGEEPTVEDYKYALDKIYFYHSAYRIIPLSSDPAIVSAVNQFVSGVSNPVDRRETVGFVSHDTSTINNINDLNELVDKVGGLSDSLNNKRMLNIFGGESVELRINGELYELPHYFLAVAVACLDSVVGRVDPLSQREIDIFERINGPRFRPRQWDKLAVKGVFIVQQDTPESPAVIRHQLTTSKSSAAEDQEYSVVKNFDVVTKKIRDRFKPYSGQHNIDAGYTERLDGTMTTVKQEILEDKLAKDLMVVTPWSHKQGADGRNLVTRLRMEPVYPANHLDVYLII